MSDEAHLSAKSNQEKAKTRFSQPHEHQGGPRDFEASPGEGARAPHGLGGLEAGLTVTHSARFRRADRVVSGRDYARVRRHGRRLSSRNFLVTVAARETGCGESARRAPGHPSNTRLGLSVSRRVGNAVMRNRIKRAVREWFRGSRERVAKDVDIVVIAHRGAAGRGAEEIALELNALFSRPREAATPRARA
jgi:ribonuclease P protein component